MIDLHCHSTASDGLRAPAAVVEAARAADLAAIALTDHDSTAGLAEAREAGAHTVELNLEPSEGASLFREAIHGPATEIVPRYVEQLLTVL